MQSNFKEYWFGEVVLRLNLKNKNPWRFW